MVLDCINVLSSPLKQVYFQPPLYQFINPPVFSYLLCILLCMPFAGQNNVFGDETTFSIFFFNKSLL